MLGFARVGRTLLSVAFDVFVILQVLDFLCDSVTLW